MSIEYDKIKDCIELRISKPNGKESEYLELWILRRFCFSESKDFSDVVFDVVEPSTRDRAGAQLLKSRIRKTKAITVESHVHKSLRGL